MKFGEKGKMLDFGVFKNWNMKWIISRQLPDSPPPSQAKNVYACSGKNNPWSISGNVIGSEPKMPAKCCWDESSDGSIFGSDSVAFSCHCKRSKIILVDVLTAVCSLENIASWNWRKIAVTWSDSVLLTLRSLVCTWKTYRKGESFSLFLFTACSVQLGTKRNYKVVEEKLLGFVLVYELACTELHGSDSFDKCVSRFCVKIRLWLWI